MTSGGRVGSAFERAVAFVLALLFLWSALSKMRDPAAFAVTIASFGIVLDAWVLPTAWILIAIEGSTALLLLGSRVVGPVLACGLLVFFLAVLGYGMRLGLDIDCGCFGPGEHVSVREAFARDTGLLALAAWLTWRRLRARQP